MRSILSITAAVGLIGGLLIWANAKSAVHEIEAACGFLLFAIAGAGSAIVDRLEGLQRANDIQNQILRQIASNGTPAGAEPIAPPPGKSNYMEDDKAFDQADWVAVFGGCAVIAIILWISFGNK